MTGSIVENQSQSYKKYCWQILKIKQICFFKCAFLHLSIVEFVYTVKLM